MFCNFHGALSHKNQFSSMLAKELAALAQEAQALKAILASAGTEGFAQRVFDKVFHTDIQRLRSMEDMWKSRKPPTPLKFDDIMSSTEDLQKAMDAATLESQNLKDQRVWNLRETVEVFCDRYELASTFTVQCHSLVSLICLTLTYLSSTLTRIVC